MAEPLDEQYLTWLYSKVGSTRLTSPSRTFWTLFRYLYKTEFLWIIPNDDNRMEDGRELRYEFLDDQRIRNVDPHWMGLGCSILEMLYALSRRLEFEDGTSARAWFWKLLENLELDKQSDSRFDLNYVEDIIVRLIWRNYEPNGRGGLFPLKHPHADQRNVEIWYQLNAYILEHE
jgi:hypothetical protein